MIKNNSVRIVLVPKEFRQIVWDEVLEDDCRQLVRLAVREDLDRKFDVTTLALIEPDSQAQAVLVARQKGLVCGIRACRVVLDEMEIDARWTPHVGDGDATPAGTALGTLSGSARDLLTAERLLLNFVGRLSGVASLTEQFVRRVSGTSCRIYDTRKTTPGWRRLEKYAVRCGGGHNHRTGLFDAVLIKDNHLAHMVEAGGSSLTLTPADAVARARQRLRAMLPHESEGMIVEVEVDSLEQLQQVLAERPDIVLLDNMSLDELREAVMRRDAAEVAIELEASGGITLDTVASIAGTGVERISVGALTHSAISLDVALDWALEWQAGT
ncbi:MAG: carboxylating nicotinate-nucleotide diphosphorylase [Pirellulaceae bacterium]